MQPTKHNPLAQFRSANAPKPGMTEEPPKPDGMEAKPEEKPEGVHIHVTKTPEGKLKSTIDDGDELGPQELEHESLEDAKTAHAEALEQKFGMEKVEQAEEKLAPGLHDKVGSFLSKIPSQK